MTKFLKVSFLAMLIVAVMALPAFAGTITFWGSPGGTSGAANVKYSVALEAMNAARNFTITSSSGTTGSGYANAPLKITPGQQLASGSLLTITLANAAFNAGATGSVLLCAATSDTASVDVPVAAQQPAANSASLSWVLGTTVSTGQFLFVTTSGTTSCSNSNASLSVQFQPVSSAALASVSYTVSLNSTTYDQKSAVNFANFAREFTTAYANLPSTIDYTTNSASNGAHFVVGTGANAANAGTANIARGTVDFSAEAVGATGASLSVAGILSLQDSASWQGVKDAYVLGSAGGGSICAAAGPGANNAIVQGAANLGTGTVNLAVSSAAFNGAASYAAVACVDVLGNTVLQSRSIKGFYTVNGGVADVDSATLLMTWSPNGYQAIIPYINGSSTFDTICTISNQGATAAPATATLLSAESIGAAGGSIPTGAQGISLGTVPANGLIRVDFTSSITPYTYSGGVETAGTAVAIPGVQGNDRMSVILNVGAGVTAIQTNCIQTDTLAGVKRNVPVLTQTSGTVPWQQ